MRSSLQSHSKKRNSGKTNTQPEGDAWRIKKGRQQSEMKNTGATVQFVVIRETQQRKRRRKGDASMRGENNGAKLAGVKHVLQS